MSETLKTIAFIPKPGSFHDDTLRERRALRATRSGDEIAVVWCWRNSVGGIYHSGVKTWAVYSGPGFNLSEFLAQLEASGVELPGRAVLDAWCLAVRKPEGRAN